MTSQTGAWCERQTALQHRRASYLAPCCVSLTPGLPWRWRGSSTTKVGKSLSHKRGSLFQFFISDVCEVHGCKLFYTLTQNVDTLEH